MGQNARLTLIQLSTDGGTVYNNVAASREDGISLAIEGIDCTTKDDGGWRTMVDDVGLKTATITSSGLTKSGDTSLEDWWDGAGAGTTINQMKFIRPGGKTYTGDFIMTTFEIGAADQDANTFSATFESAGAVTVTDT